MSSGGALPSGLTPHHVDSVSHERGAVARRIVLGLLTAGVVLAAAGVAGQRPTTIVAENEAAKLSVYAPDRLRGGLLYTTRFHVWARRPLRAPTLVLDPGWFEGMQVNSITPQPRAQSSRDGRVVLQLKPMAAGDDAVLFIQFQVNPTNVGRRSQDVRFEDTGERLFELRRTVTVFP